MASTASNKQPLLVDHVLHEVYSLDSSITSTLDIAGTNTAQLVVNAVDSDGAVLESIYSIARSTTEHTINLYLSTATDYLRPTEGILIGQFKSATTIADVTSWSDMPGVLAPTAHVGADATLKALYIPKGKALWAARQSASTVTDSPILGVQGGWY